MSSSTEMKVVRLVKPGEPLQLGTMEKPTPGPREVVVKVEASGIVPNFRNIVSGRNPGSLPNLPAVFGLDAAGTIESVGRDVLHLKVGDRCYANPHITCDACHQCRRGRKDLCEFGCLRGYFSVTEAGAALLNQHPIGALSQYITSPDSKIAVLPESVDFLTASRFGYIGTSYAALKKAQVGPGKTVLINGVTGTLGVAAVAIALGFGATRILGIGRNVERLIKVQEMSKAGRVVTRSSEQDGNIVDWVLEQTKGRGVDALIDCLGYGGEVGGTEQLIKGAIKMGGSCVLLAGGADGNISSKYYEYMMRDISILGSMWFTDGEADEMIEAIGTGVIDLSMLEHRTWSLEDANEAIEIAGDRQGGFVNCVVLPNGKGEEK